MNAIIATTAACTAVSGGRVCVRAVVGFVVLARAEHYRLRRRDAQGWRPVDAVLALGIAARTQCCPSKHPDGYRESVIRR